jgi:hypothetical protein
MPLFTSLLHCFRSRSGCTRIRIEWLSLDPDPDPQGSALSGSPYIRIRIHKDPHWVALPWSGSGSTRIRIKWLSLDPDPDLQRIRIEWLSKDPCLDPPWSALSGSPLIWIRIHKDPHWVALPWFGSRSTRIRIEWLSLDPDLQGSALRLSLDPDLHQDTEGRPGSSSNKNWQKITK